MRIVLELHCPEDHDPIAVSGELDTSRLVTSLVRPLAQRRCPACPASALEPGLTVIDGQNRRTAYCPCCRATWVPQRPVRLLSAGRLLGAELVSRAGVRS
ncbi:MULTISPECIES: hypothetical protein [Nocardia]|uniref:hypothetical protein n=1 Tax=Nocardia TaxID=1817 RepID=UPI000D69B454|nr:MULTISPECIES: hypothetical protein [Nocardia]